MNSPKILKRWNFTVIHAVENVKKNTFSERLNIALVAALSSNFCSAFCAMSMGGDCDSPAAFWTLSYQFRSAFPAKEIVMILGLKITFGTWAEIVRCRSFLLTYRHSFSPFNKDGRKPVREAA
jgi:hypothetical protein